ncbi:MAG: hypothetical protein P8126_01070 [Gammaproteobacteria bacterium]
MVRLLVRGGEKEGKLGRDESRDHGQWGQLQQAHADGEASGCDDKTLRRAGIHGHGDTAPLEFTCSSHLTRQQETVQQNDYAPKQGRQYSCDTLPKERANHYNRRQNKLRNNDVM